MSLRPAGAGAAARRLRPPPGLIERTRWLFCCAALLSLALCLPGAAHGEGGRAVLVLAAATVTLAGIWVQRYRTGRASLAADLLEALTTATFAAFASGPSMAFGFVFTATWQRAVYGRWRDGLRHAVLVATAILTSLWTWPSVAGHVGALDHATVLGPVPLIFLVGGVARHLASHLFAREQAVERQAALARLSADLLAATSAAEVGTHVWEAVSRVSRATPGSAVVGVEECDGALRVSARTGSHLVPGTPVPGTAGQTGAGPVLRPGLLPGLLPGTVQEALQRGHDRPGPWSALKLPVPRGGRARWLLLHAGTGPAEELTSALHAVLDQAALALRGREAHDELVAAALTDDLTRLANRTAFVAALRDALTAPAGQPSSRSPRGRPVVLFCDLDGFKFVNDGLGHAAGDDVLREVARRMQDALRPGDLCARLGGDEFAVLMLLEEEADGARTSDPAGPRGNDVSTSALASAAARRLVERVSRPLQVQGRQVRVGISVGVAVAGDDDDAGELLRSADVAMYAAKASGKNTVRSFDAGLRAELRAATAGGAEWAEQGASAGPNG